MVPAPAFTNESAPEVSTVDPPYFRTLMEAMLTLPNTSSVSLGLLMLIPTRAFVVSALNTLLSPDEFLIWKVVVEFVLGWNMNCEAVEKFMLPVPVVVRFIPPFVPGVSAIAPEPVPPWMVVTLDPPTLPTLTVCVCVPPVPTPTFTVLALLVSAPIFTVVVLELPTVIVPAALVFSVILPEPSATVLPVVPCKVSVPVVVDHVELAADVMVSAPAEVVRLDAALAVSDSAPLDWFRSPVTVVALLSAIAVAFVVPRLSVPAAAVSSRGVCKDVLARPVPLILKLAVWSEALWFWM